ncbi:hypothetical protein RHCRD62_40512 [Rhodococcus sp. RD6.2]|jgi:hypothetical protein|nr:hypothetical protein RHCRD62_40512 [Rhodococcus sp. RD6.2]
MAVIDPELISAARGSVNFGALVEIEPLLAI